jgi:hypothetical protein
MPTNESARGTAAFQLRQAVERLHGEIERVEFWATALDQMAQPIPEYDATAQPLNAFNLPRHNVTRDDAGKSAVQPAANGTLPTMAGPMPNRR